MARRCGSLRFLLWAFVSTLVLKAAVPLLAAGAAHLQGVPVGSICGVYGVTLPGKADPHAHHHAHHGQETPAEDAPSHAGGDREHCALTGLAAMAAWQLVPLATHTAAAIAQRLPDIPAPHAVDACAAWAARMQHPPPAHAPVSALLG